MKYLFVWITCLFGASNLQAQLFTCELKLPKRLLVIETELPSGKVKLYAKDTGNTVPKLLLQETVAGLDSNAVANCADMVLVGDQVLLYHALYSPDQGRGFKTIANLARGIDKQAKVSKVSLTDKCLALNLTGKTNTYRTCDNGATWQEDSIVQDTAMHGPHVQNNPLQQADQLPLYPGGEPAMWHYMNDQLRYPKQALNKRIQGTVVVQFTVEESGSITDVQVLKGIGSGCDEEAVRLIKGMPAWKPATLKGKPVKYSYYLPVNFVMD